MEQIAAGDNDGNGSDSGHVVYQYNSWWWRRYGEWEKLGEDIDGEAAGDESGYSVSLSRGTLLWEHVIMMVKVVLTQDMSIYNTLYPSSKWYLGKKR